MTIKDVTRQGQNCSFFTLFFFLLFFVYNAIAFAAENTAPAELKQSADQGVIYACPMHPDEISDAPGSCSICGMFLVAQEKHEHDSDDLKPARPTATGSDKPADLMAADHLQQNRKPGLFWESREYPASNNKQHSHRQSGRENHPLTQRMPATTQAGVSATTDQHMLQSSTEHDKNHIKKQQGTTYICPMHPQIMQHEPGGNCPICGMNLVAKETAAPAGGKPQVFLQAAVIQNMGVRIATVDRKILDKLIHTQGLVTADDDRLLSIHPRTGGWIEVLHLLTEGDRVERKDVLVNFYSPWINQVQLDYITALEEYDQVAFDPSRKTELAAKVESLRNSLRLLNVMDMDIMRIKNSRKVQNTIQLMAPQGGIITRLNVNEGSYVEPYQSMFTIVDLSQVWVMVDIYEHQAPWVRKGQEVEITAPAIPARSWSSVVDFIYPAVNPKTRTLRARIVVPNPDEALLLNMFVKVNITANTSKQAVLTVPREAVIITGERETVIKSLGKGHFQPVDVKTGMRGEGNVEILSGLQQGDEIVVSGQFLIDSESSLQASFLRMSE
jgi:Cu(I)/Ag(I) efflux system membrane fusion protein